MKLSLTFYLAAALVVSLVVNAVQLYLAGGQKPKCELGKAEAVIDANDQQRAEESKRDEKLDKVTWETQIQTRTAVVQVEKETNERAAAIDRVPVSGDCRAPVGLPDLDAAVDKANAAAGH